MQISNLATEDRSRSTVFLVAAFIIYWLIALRLDIGTDALGQFFLSLTAWAFLLFSLRFSPWSERGQVLTMIVVATCGEVFGSLILGAYTYRLDNLPMFVPPGHGLFYLYALRASELPLFQRHTGSLRWCAFFGSTALLLPGLLVPTHPDLFGLITWIGFMVCLMRSASPMYSISFALTMALEYYGTGLGNWRWAAELPIIGIPSANPPACIGVGYCVMDAVTRLLAPKVQGLITSQKVFEFRQKVNFGTLRRHLVSRSMALQTAQAPPPDDERMSSRSILQQKVEGLSSGKTTPSSHV